MAVTFSSKRYISICASCRLLFDSTRRDRLTCSGACRIRAHRNGDIEPFKAAAKYAGSGVEVFHVLQAQAIAMLCPELVPSIQDGSLTLDEAQKDAALAFDRLVMQEMRNGEIEETEKDAEERG